MAEVGRPSEMTEEKVKKLEEVAALDGTIEEMCFYADISKTTYYNWLEKEPELVDRLNALRQRPILKARQTIVKNLDNPMGAQWYLERKVKEFKPKQDFTSNEERIVAFNLISPNDNNNTDNKAITETIPGVEDTA